MRIIRLVMHTKLHETFSCKRKGTVKGKSKQILKVKRISGLTFYK